MGSVSAAGIRPSMAQSATFAIPSKPIGPIPAGSSLRWIDSGDNKARFYKAFMPQYSAARGGAEIVYDGLPWDQIGTVVPLGIRNGTAQDVFSLPLSVSGAYAVANGWVQPIDDYIPDIQTWKAGFPAGAFLEGLNVFGGKTYGLPYNSGRTSGANLLYDVPTLQDAGFDPASKPMSWDDMRQAALKITQAGNGSRYGWIIGGSQVNRWALVVRGLAQSSGAAGGGSALWADLDFRTGEYLFDTDAYVGAIELLLAMQKDGSAFPGLVGMNAPQARAFTAQGAASMILQGPWCVPQWEIEAPAFNFGSARTPAMDPSNGGPQIVSAVASEYNTMWLWKGSRNQQLAADLFHYLGTVEGQTDWVNVVGPADPPILPAAVQTAKISVRSQQVLKLGEDTVRVGPNPLVRKPALVDAIAAYKAPTPGFAGTVQGLYSGQLSDVKQAMIKVKSQMNSALDAALAEAKKAGSDVSRDDLVFANWDPSRDYVQADYDAL